MAKKKREAQEIQGEINAYKQLLANTDYQAIKHSEGVISDEDYEAMKEERESYRAAINDLEAELETVNG